MLLNEEIALDLLDELITNELALDAIEELLLTTELLLVAELLEDTIESQTLPVITGFSARLEFLSP